MTGQWFWIQAQLGVSGHLYYSGPGKIDSSLYLKIGFFDDLWLFFSDWSFKLATVLPIFDKIVVKVWYKFLGLLMYSKDFAVNVTEMPKLSPKVRLSRLLEKWSQFLNSETNGLKPGLSDQNFSFILSLARIAKLGSRKSLKMKFCTGCYDLQICLFFDDCWHLFLGSGAVTRKFSTKVRGGFLGRFQHSNGFKSCCFFFAQWYKSVSTKGFGTGCFGWILRPNYLVEVRSESNLG